MSQYYYSLAQYALTKSNQSLLLLTGVSLAEGCAIVFHRCSLYFTDLQMKITGAFLTQIITVFDGFKVIFNDK